MAEQANPMLHQRGEGEPRDSNKNRRQLIRHRHDRKAKEQPDGVQKDDE